MSADVSIIGLGRVGLPLALCFADRGLRVLGVDRDLDRLESVRAARMPFDEPGAQEMLERVIAAGRLELTDRVSDAATARDIILTLGTPSFSHIEIDMRDIRSALDGLLPVLAPGHAIILRSTVAPGTTEFVAGYIEQRRGLRAGEDIFVVHCPERIVGGQLHRGDRHAPVHRRWPRQRIDRAGRGAVQRVQRADRAYNSRPG